MLDTSIRKSNRVGSFSIASSLVVHMLDTTIRKSNRVGSFSIASTITSLGSVESSLGVVISNSVGVSVRGRHVRVGYRGSMDNWGSVDNGGMVDNGGSMDKRGTVDNGCSMDKGSMNSMSNTVSSNRNDGSMSNSNRPVSTNGRLDLRETLSIVYLRNRSMGSRDGRARFQSWCCRCFCHKASGFQRSHGSHPGPWSPCMPCTWGRLQPW